MKTTLLSMAVLFLSFGMKAQTVSTFESLSLEASSFWDGADLAGSFTDGNATFNNVLSYGYWTSGFAYSNMKDSTSAGWANQYSARTGVGCNNSVNYALGQSGAQIKLNGMSKGKVVNGFYVTNTTYAALSMKDGDEIAKKFGGVSGNDADYFMLTVKGWFNGDLLNDSVNFYLADYRFENNSQDYILKSWEWVDLTSLGNIDSLKFVLSSSDNSEEFMNTPGYFAIDNFTASNSGAGINGLSSVSLSVFPNPVCDALTLNLHNAGNALLTIYDADGRTVLTENKSSISKTVDVSLLPVGLYFISLRGDEWNTTTTFVKQ